MIFEVWKVFKVILQWEILFLYPSVTCVSVNLYVFVSYENLKFLVEILILVSFLLSCK